MEGSVSVPGVALVRELGGIAEYQLKGNGMRILLAQDMNAPVAGVMVTYHVGSRNEATGYTGATHLLEHLMFKGTDTFHPSKGTGIDRLLETRGAIMNATTWMDRTNYYEVVPKDVLPLALEIEASRMRNATFTEEERQSEMPIVRNEFERGENNPLEALDKAVWAAAFMAHPYHHSTIGWRSDIEGVSIERLRQFYDDFYWPENATLTVVGNFDAKATLSLAKKFFGVHPRKSAAYPRLYTEEPPQEGQRRVVVKRAGNPLLCVAHKIPDALHADIPALSVLSLILNDDKTSRLYKAFVDTAISTGILVQCNQFHDASLFQTFIFLSPGVTHAKAEAMLAAEYRKIIEGGVTAPELAAAKRSWRVAASHRKDGPFALLSALNEEIATGDWTRFITFPEAVQRVTAKDVQRVAKAYLLDDQSTVGFFIPTA